jgi:dTDP-4-amino-4,6-dideoxygalactose transaminase
MNLKKTIFTGFAPNLTTKDALKAFGFLFFPWKWSKLKKGKDTQEAEEWIKNYFGAKNAFVCDSGRTALFFGIKSMDIKEGDEVAVQAYTCMVVINAIKMTGAKPVYIDVDTDFNMDPDDLSKKITDKTKLIIIQHTFGLPAQIDKIIDIAKNHNIKTIEDCAHALGAKHRGKKLGTFADLSIFSFGSDKVLSCNRGGALITNNEKYAKNFEELRSKLNYVPTIKIIQLLMHFLVFLKGKILYSFGVGKFILYISKKANIINKIIYNEEKKGSQVSFYPALLPNCLANILIDQLENLDKVNVHRKKISLLYDKLITNKSIIKPKITEDGIYLRYTILVDNPDMLRTKAKKQNIILGDWYNTVIAPKDIDMNVTNYNLGSCPKAEEYSLKSINLPTNINTTEKDVERIVSVINL